MGSISKNLHLANCSIILFFGLFVCLVVFVCLFVFLTVSHIEISKDFTVSSFGVFS